MSTDTRPSLLYITPSVPVLTGNGLAMRAGMVLEALSEFYKVSVLIVPVYPLFAETAALRQRCEQWVNVGRVVDPRSRIALAAAAYANSRFDIIHVFRLSVLPYARAYLTERDGRPRRHLDLDDMESKTHRRLAVLCRENGDSEWADREFAEAKRRELLEAASFGIFDRVYVCSEADRRETAERCRAELCVLPNAVRLPAEVRPPVEDGRIRLLFVGTMGYYPNSDAAVYFCSRILPLIRQKAPCSVDFTIVGGGLPDAIRDYLATGGNIHVTGQVPDLEPYYNAADQVVVPVRAGGGTRIKILEAFSYRRPVVTTSIGLEGIDANPGEHVLTGDTPEEFADCCLRLMTDRALRDRLSANASALLSQSYSSEALRRIVACLSAREALPESRSDVL